MIVPFSSSRNQRLFFDQFNFSERQPVVHIPEIALINRKRCYELDVCHFNQYQVTLSGPVDLLFRGQAQFGLVFPHQGS